MTTSNTDAQPTAEVSTEGAQAGSADSLRALVQMYSPMPWVANDFPIALVAVQAALDAHYDFKIDSLELSEKNKGGEYSSSGISLKTSLVQQQMDPLYGMANGPHPLQDLAWNLKGVPADILFPLYALHQNIFASITPVASLADPGAPLVDTMQIYTVPQAKNAQFLVDFRAMRVHATGINGPMLNGYRQTQYLRHLTKWAELNANPSSNKAYADAEFASLTSLYTLFLIDILFAYFGPHPA